MQMNMRRKSTMKVPVDLWFGYVLYSTLGLMMSALVVIFFYILIAFSTAGTAYSASLPTLKKGEGARIKDIVQVEGIRENLLIGYGLVVGLNGTGDNLTNSVFTQKGLADFLGRLGVNTKGANLKTKNVAAVTVTASLPPFSRHGSRIDVSVSTMGDAKSLQGGMLLATPLLGADGQVYALAQGPIAVGGFTVTGNSGSTVSKGVPTNGQIAQGGIIEKEIDFSLNSMNTINLALRNPDISTAKVIAATINRKIKNKLLSKEDIFAATAIDPGTVALKVPEIYKGDVMELLADVEQLRVLTDQVARIVVDEASGTIVMGENVRVDTVAIAQGNLTIRINEEPYISQPLPFSEGETAMMEKTFIEVKEDDESRMTILDGGATLGELVAGLNALGVGPRDLITILQTVKSAGALQAEIETR
ncbi:MAG: flgI [Rickettsiales bacterium]|jgi:flagellar P-ring protein precursor FlgI|nr:flgI [Rickettsiales bacterium]